MEYDTKWPAVCLHPIVFLGKYFRCDRHQRSALLSRWLLRVVSASEAKVRELNHDIQIVSRRVHQEVIQLDIPMDDTLLVALCHSFCHLIEKFANLRLMQLFIQLCQNYAHVSWHELQNDTDIVTILEDCLDLQYRLVVHLLHHAVLEISGVEIDDIHLAFLENLDGNFVTRDRVMGLMDLGLSAISERPADLESVFEV